jgi:NAD-dependent DNA ligase
MAQYLIYEIAGLIVILVGSLSYFQWHRSRQIQQQLKALEQEREELNSQLSQAGEKKDFLTWEKDKLQQEKSNLKEELSQVKENFDRELKQEREKVSSLEEQVTQLSLEKENLTSQLQLEEEKVSSLEQQVTQLNLEKENLTSQLQQQEEPASHQIPPSSQPTPVDFTPKKETSLAGKKLVILGRLKKLTRNQIKELMQKAGGSVSTSLSYQTDYLIVGKSPGLKQLKKAEKLGLNQLSEKQFLELLELAQISPD